MKTRLRSLSATAKKSPVKKKSLTKSPSSPDICSASHQTKPLSKQTRKNISPKHSQSVPSLKTVTQTRQNSRPGSSKADTTGKKKRIGSGKKLKKVSKSNPSSISGSRASSPR